MTFFSRIIDTAIALFIRPGEFFRESRGEAGLGFPFAFAATMGALSGIIAHLVQGPGVGGMMGRYGATGGIIGSTFGGIATAIVGVLIAGVLVLLLSLLSGGKPTGSSSLRIACFSTIVGPISNAVGFYVPLGFPLPLSAIVDLCGAAIVVLGVVELHGARLARAVALVVVAFAVLWGGALLAMREMRDWFGSFEPRIAQEQEHQLETARSARLKMEARQREMAQASVPSDSRGAEARAPAERETPTPSPVITLPLRIRSVPEGAQVTMVPGGEVLGVTPFTWRVRKGAKPFQLRFSLAGLAEQVVDVNGDVEAEVLVNLQKRAQ
jgi:hypothetical protein